MCSIYDFSWTLTHRKIYRWEIVSWKPYRDMHRIVRLLYRFSPTWHLYITSSGIYSLGWEIRTVPQPLPNHRLCSNLMSWLYSCPRFVNLLERACCSDSSTGGACTASKFTAFIRTQIQIVYKAPEFKQYPVCTPLSCLYPLQIAWVSCSDYVVCARYDTSNHT